MSSVENPDHEAREGREGDMLNSELRITIGESFRSLRKLLPIVVLTKNVLITKRTKATKKYFSSFAPLGEIYFSFVLFEYFVVKFPVHFGCGSATLGSSRPPW